MEENNLIFLTDGARHLICLPYSIENLHEMAKQLDIKPCWFHKCNHPHYDIPKRRIKEIETKCNKITSVELVNIINSNK
jgi:hypothetical protein